ncbi:MAG: alpha/beta hydrolase family protein [Oscillospiraceae bacterium]|nr:alpha/beta hydrolase family protein [Oscillospiraceae bacterium]
MKADLKNLNLTFSERLLGYYDVGTQLRDYIFKISDGYFKKAEEERMNIKTAAQAEARRDRIRKKFIEAIGGLDFEKCPLNVRITGVINGDGYIIQKVIYESLPKMYVTANLYLPENISGTIPVVVIASGHWTEAKAGAQHQKVALDLIKNGMAAFAIDPIGQGERLQYDDFDENGNYNVGWTTSEHNYEGNQCAMTGANVARYMIWDLMRGIDYLETLDFIDKTKIGITGCSGGGTQSSYMMLCDERLSAAVPSCYITTRDDYMLTGQQHDLEQNIFGAITEGIDYSEFIINFAPKPAQINCVRYDFFCIEGSVKSYERALEVYKLYGCEDNIKIYIDDKTHDYTDGLREGMVNFFRKHFLNLPEDFKTDPQMETRKPESLNCTATGQIVKEFSDVKNVYRYNLDFLNDNKYSPPQNKSQLKDRITELLNFPQDINVREKIIYPRVLTNGTYEDVTWQHTFFFSETGICVAGLMITAADSPKYHCTVFVGDDSTGNVQKYSEQITKLLEKGSVFVFDPRGTGAVKYRSAEGLVYKNKYGILFGSEFKFNCDATMLKTSLTALRVYDVLRAFDYVKDTAGFAEVSLAGADNGILYTLFAGALLAGAEQIYSFGKMQNYEDIVRTEFYNITPNILIHGVLKYIDISVIGEILNVDIQENNL